MSTRAAVFALLLAASAAHADPIYVAGQGWLFCSGNVCVPEPPMRPAARPASAARPAARPASAAAPRIRALTPEEVERSPYDRPVSDEVLRRAFPPKQP
jgi:hypothetical protein